jgi:hypothetical protein
MATLFRKVLYFGGKSDLKDSEHDSYCVASELLLRSQRPVQLQITGCLAAFEAPLGEFLAIVAGRSRTPDTSKASRPGVLAV